jgi:hypothetical protein
MAREPNSVDDVLIRATDYFAHLDGRTPEQRSARQRHYGRMGRSVAKRGLNIGMALVALIIATIGFGLLVGPIGWTGLFVVVVLTILILAVFSILPMEPKRVAYSEQVPTRTVVQQLESLLVRRRSALPGAATRRVDAISAQLPLLESRLGEIDALDPLAQDARRLMGKHLPDLIDRYERIPSAYRHERDGDGLTVDERLVASLDAAKNALDDIGSKLAHGDRQAFETQGRFIESRYKDGGPKGE